MLHCNICGNDIKREVGVVPVHIADVDKDILCLACPNCDNPIFQWDDSNGWVMIEIVGVLDVTDELH